MQWIRARPTLACRPVRRLKLSGKRRMVILNELTCTVLRSLQTNYVFSLIHTARRYSSTRTQASAWSRALTTAWSRAYCAITIMASNTYLTMDHDREIAEFISPFR